MSSLIDELRQISSEVNGKIIESRKNSYPELLENVKRAAEAGKSECRFPAYLFYKSNLQPFWDEGFKISFDGHEDGLPKDYFEINKHIRQQLWIVSW